MKTLNGLPYSNGDPAVLVEEKSPTFLSPRWVWRSAVATLAVVTPTFWKRWKEPEHQATWQVSSALTWVQAFGLGAAIKFLETNAPWVLSGLSAIGAVIKGIVTAIVAICVAAWNVLTP